MTIDDVGDPHRASYTHRMTTGNPLSATGGKTAQGIRERRDVSVPASCADDGVHLRWLREAADLASRGRATDITDLSDEEIDALLRQ